jgi:MFS family permease
MGSKTNYTFREQVQGMPWAQLVVVAIMRFAEPVSFTSLFPYIYFMVKSFNVCPEHQIARYAGYISGAFALCQCLTGILWGRISDRIGRKPVILIGLSGSALSLLLLGLSRNFYMAVMARCVAGLLNGNVGVIRTLLGEIAKKRRHQAIAFSIMPLLWQVGCVTGPMLGGYLAQPVQAHPDWFTEGSTAYTLFTKYPFLLPNIIVSSVLVFGAVVAFFFLDETHDIKQYEHDIGRSITKKLKKLLLSKKKNKNEAGDDDFESKEDEETSPLLSRDQSRVFEHVDQSWKAILCPSVVKSLTSAFFLAMHCIVYEELLPIFLETEPEMTGRGPSRLPFHLVGGLGFSSEKVGNLLSMNGMVGILVMVVIFPWVDSKFGTLNPYLFMLKLYPIVYFLVPYFVMLLQLPKPLMDLIIIANLFFRTLVNALANPQLLLLTNRAPAHTRHLGVVNGCVQVASSFARAIGPIVWGYFMTMGQQFGYAQLPWWSLSLIALIGTIQASFMTDKDEDGNVIS